MLQKRKKLWRIEKPGRIAENEDERTERTERTIFKTMIFEITWPCRKVEDIFFGIVQDSKPSTKC